jgi:hypothetical protein
VVAMGTRLLTTAESRQTAKYRKGVNMDEKADTINLDAESPRFQRAWAKIVGQAWASPEFKGRLIQDPAAVLREHGVDVPAEVRLTIDEEPLSRLFAEKLGRVPFAQAAGAGTIATLQGGGTAGTAASIASFGSVCGTAGTFGCVGTAGSQSGPISQTQAGLSRLGSAGTMGVSTVGSAGSVGSIGCFCGTAGTFGTGGTAGSHGAAPGVAQSTALGGSTAGSAGTAGTLGTVLRNGWVRLYPGERGNSRSRQRP